MATIDPIHASHRAISDVARVVGRGPVEDYCHILSQSACQSILYAMESCADLIATLFTALSTYALPCRVLDRFMYYPIEPFVAVCNGLYYRIGYPIELCPTLCRPVLPCGALRYTAR